ncbi:SPOSA6832_00649, partial [Sporobolomyces salmonicolor]
MPSRASFSFLAALALLLPLVSAVKFSLQAGHNPPQKCLWNYAMADTLVVISVSAPMAGSMQRLDMEVVDGSASRNTAPQYVRLIDLDVDIGADAVDYNAIAKQESLSGLEVEMRKLEGVVKEIVEELNYLKRREARMRDTNGALS